MKALFSALLILTTLGTRAVNDSLLACEKQAIENAKAIVMFDDAAEAMKLEGSATVTFEIDENKMVHVKEVQASDFTIAFHIRQALNGAVICSSDILAGKKFTVLMQFPAQNQPLSSF